MPFKPVFESSSHIDNPTDSFSFNMYDSNIEDERELELFAASDAAMTAITLAAPAILLAVAS